MPRRTTFPPRILKHISGRAFVRWKGRDYYLGPYGSEEAQRRYLELLPKLPRDMPQAMSGTVAEVVAAWFTQEGPRFSARGGELQKYRLSVEPLLAMFGETAARDFDADRLEQVQLAMANASWMTPTVREERERLANRGPVEWSRLVVNQRVKRIRTVWRWCERKKLVPSGAWGNLRSLPGLQANDPRVRHLPKVKPAVEKDVAAVLAECPPPVRAMVALMWWTGMRPGEVRIMRPCDLDRTDADCWVYRPAQHKNEHRGHERAVPLGSRAIKLIDPWLGGAGPEDYLFRPWPHLPRRAYRGDGMSLAIRRAAARAGVVGFHAYRCRHAVKARMTREMGLDAARSVLGQRSLGSTNGYAESIDLEQAKDAARKLG